MSKRRAPEKSTALRIQIRDVTGDDYEPVRDLFVQASPDEEDSFETVLQLGELGPRGVLPHGIALLSAAWHRGRIVGALMAGPPDWASTHPGIGDFQQRIAFSWRVTEVVGIAVVPEHRRKGIARALLADAEQRFTRAKFGLVILDHRAHLTGFYARAGYTLSPRGVMIHTPTVVVGQESTPGHLTSIKALGNGAELRVVPGFDGPVVSGLLGERLPASAHYNGRILTTPS